jgi:general secretion pathway protein N
MSIKSRRWPLVLAFVVGFVASVLSFPPVTWLTDKAGELTGQRLTIGAVRGNLWKGDGQLVLFDGSQARAIPGRLQWQIRPLAWFEQGSALLTVQHDSLAQPVSLMRAAQGFQLSGSQLQFPANWLEAIGTPWNTLRPAGAIRLKWAPITVGQPFTVTLRWQDAQSALSVVKPLGSYEVLVDFAQNGSMAAKLNTMSGDLRLEGQASWNAAQGFAFTGYASASPSQEAALTGLLSQMGRLENNRYRLGS